MPIKPENRSRYPANWQKIRDAVRARSRDHCEGSPDFPDCRRGGWQSISITMAVLWRSYARNASK